MPLSSAAELSRATARLVDGDYSGAITAACGAVDLATQSVYEKYKIGGPGKSSFSTKVNTSLKHLHIWEEVEQEFQALV